MSFPLLLTLNEILDCVPLWELKDWIFGITGCSGLSGKERLTQSENQAFYLEGDAQDSKPFFVYILSRNKIILWAVYIMETMRKEKIEKVSSQRELFEG